MKVRRKDGIYQLKFTWPQGPIVGKAPTGMEYVKLEITERIYNGCDCYPWRKTFAFWPVKTIGGQTIWLRTVYKQKFWAVWGAGFHMEPHVEYATILEVLTNENQ